MKVANFAAKVVLTATIALPMVGSAQTYHEHRAAVHAQHRSDARHHTKAKIVAGSAVGGAVVGGLLGGPKGAVIGAGVGAGGGLLANKARENHDVKKREQTGRY